MMLPKHKVITNILRVGVVAIVRTDLPENAEKIAQACFAGGLSAVEVTFTVRGAHRIIERLATTMEGEGGVLGAGTVLDAPTARVAILSGAAYIVSPNFDRDTALLCNRYATPYMAGCSTATEIVCAMEYGVEIIKLFPAVGLQPTMLTALRAPLAQANFMPTGGINLGNAGAWIAAGAVALGVGGDLVAGAKTGDFAQITKNAIAYRQEVERARAARG